MDLGKSKPSLVDPHLLKKLNIRNKITAKHLSWISKDIKDYLLIGIFILLLGYFLYSRYNSVKETRTPVIENNNNKIIVTDDGFNDSNPYYQPPFPPSKDQYNRHQYQEQVNQRQQMELREQQEQQFKRVNHPINISEPKPININPSEKFQQEDIHPSIVHPDDYSLKGKSFTNQNPTLVGSNFAPL